MGIGTGNALIVIGAVLKFATHMAVSGIDLQMIGLICMLAGALALVLSLVMNAQRQRVHSVVDRHDTAVRDPRV